MWLSRTAKGTYRETKQNKKPKPITNKRKERKEGNRQTLEGYLESGGMRTGFHSLPVYYAP